MFIFSSSFSSLVVCASPPSLVAATVDQLFDIIIYLFIFFLTPKQSNSVFGRKKEREFYEKVFPELRKQREDRERFSRVGSRIKSDADLEEIMDGLQEQEVLPHGLVWLLPLVWGFVSRRILELIGYRC